MATIDFPVDGAADLLESRLASVIKGIYVSKSI
jgi:hypothetical protein